MDLQKFVSKKKRKKKGRRREKNETKKSIWNQPASDIHSLTHKQEKAFIIVSMISYTIHTLKMGE
jgi:hypothetical protein